MFDTIAPNKQTTRVLVLFLLSGLPSPLSGRTSVAGNAGVTRFSKVGAVSSPSAGVGAATVQAPSPRYDITIQDDASTGCSVYYSFDPPTPPTSISAPGFNRSGGNLTIRLVVDSDSFNPASTQTCESIPML